MYCPPGESFVTQLLDFFECAPRLHTIILEDSVPASSDAPYGRIVSLPHLKILEITTEAEYVIIPNYLRIPSGASLTLYLSSNGLKSPLREHLPETFTNLTNLSLITTIHLLLDDKEKYVRLSGPNGWLDVLTNLRNESVSRRHIDSQILRSLSPHFLSTTQLLVISEYKPPYPMKVEGTPLFQALSQMNTLRTLVLAMCDNLHFILALDPQKNRSKLMICPDLGELILYIASQDQFHIGDLLTMTKERALRGAKLRSIRIVGLGGLTPAEGVYSLREHVAHVDYKVGDAPPDWDHVPGEGSE